MTSRATPPLMKTETAADYARRHARNPLTHAHAASLQQAIAARQAAQDQVAERIFRAHKLAYAY